MRRPTSSGLTIPPAAKRAASPRAMMSAPRSCAARSACSKRLGFLSGRHRCHQSSQVPPCSSISSACATSCATSRSRASLHGLFGVSASEHGFSCPPLSSRAVLSPNDKLQPLGTALRRQHACSSALGRQSGPATIKRLSMDCARFVHAMQASRASSHDRTRCASMMRH